MFVIGGNRTHNLSLIKKGKATTNYYLIDTNKTSKCVNFAKQKLLRTTVYEPKEQRANFTK